MTLTSNFSSITIPPTLYDTEIPTWFVDTCWGRGMSHAVIVTGTLTPGLSSWKIGSAAYLLYYLGKHSYILYVNTYWDRGESPTAFRSQRPWPVTSAIYRSSPEHIGILFEVGIQNLVRGHILGSRSVAFCFCVPLTSGLGFRKIVKKACPMLPNCVLHVRFILLWTFIM